MTGVAWGHRTPRPGPQLGSRFHSSSTEPSWVSYSYVQSPQQAGWAFWPWKALRLPRGDTPRCPQPYMVTLQRVSSLHQRPQQGPAASCSRAGAVLWCPHWP